MAHNLWISVTNTEKNIRVGIIYVPQENVTPSIELKIMNKNRKRRKITNTNPGRSQYENRSSNKKETRRK